MKSPWYSGLIKLKSIISLAVILTCLGVWLASGDVPELLAGWGALIIGSLYGGKEKSNV